METGLTRTVATLSPTPPVRGPEASAATATELPAEATVQQSLEPRESAPRDGRQESDQRRQEIALPSVRRREIENDAATGMTVMKVIEETSGEIVDQVPADAYLRMKVALQTLLESNGRSSRLTEFSA